MHPPKRVPILARVLAPVGSAPAARNNLRGFDLTPERHGRWILNTLTTMAAIHGH